MTLFRVLSEPLKTIVFDDGFLEFEKKDLKFILSLFGISTNSDNICCHINIYIYVYCALHWRK